MKKHEIDAMQRFRINNMVNSLAKMLERIEEESDVTLRDVAMLRVMKSDLVEIGKLDTGFWVNDDGQVYRNPFNFVLEESEEAYDVAYKKAQKTKKHGKAGKRGRRTTAKAS